ncbi:MAG: site-specific integrase [Lachnospiraceae bacterium]|nr:site-specific integrase [Lachnospiraceae bacterium]
MKENDVEASTTYQIYSYRVGRMKQYFQKENPKVTDISAHVVDSYCQYLQKYGKQDQKTGEKGPLASRSVKEYKHLLSSILTQAVVDGIIQYNPAKDVKVKATDKCNTDAEDYIFLSENEISDLLHFIKKEYPFLFGITFIAIYFGFRRSEIIGLRISAFDFNKHTVTIKHTVTAGCKPTARDRTKTRKSYRTLALFPTAEILIKNIITQKESNRSFYGDTYNENDYLFTWEDGHIYDPNYISGKFSEATRKFGRPEITLHKLRHTCASLLIERGWNPKKVQYWLGHEDIQTTLNIYAHYERTKLNQDYENLEELVTAVGDLID